MEEREFTYMKKFASGYTVAIIHSWGAYYVARICQTPKGSMTYTIRRYKTLSGAEKFLLTKISYGADENDALETTEKATEEFIRKGNYWR